MSKDENQRQPGGPLAAAVGQASGVIAAALTEYLGRTLQAAGYRGVDSIAGGLGGESRGDSVSDSISSVFSQYRDALGDLAAVLPQVVQRANQEWRVEPGMRLLFRARQSVFEEAQKLSVQGVAVKALYDAVEVVLRREIGEKRKDIDAGFLKALDLRADIGKLEKQIPGATDSATLEALRAQLLTAKAELAGIQPPEDWQHVIATQATLEAVRHAVISPEGRNAHPSDPMHALGDRMGASPDWAMLKTLLGQVGEQFSSKGRESVPDVLEKQKHKIRNDPVSGLAGLRQDLDWMFEPDTALCYLLLQTLDQSLGAVAVGEILHRQGLFGKFVAALDVVAKASPYAPPEWEAQFRKAFAAIGYPLGGALTLLAQNTRERSEFVLLDHAHNRMFGIREGEVGFDRKSGREIEIYGQQEGRSYCTSTSPTTPRTLPHRIHDAAVGMGVWTVDRREVQALLDSDPQRPPVRLGAWDMGANRTPLALFVVHYRESDIAETSGADPREAARDRASDEHYELGLGCFVAPRNDPLAMGMMVLGALPVSMPKACEVGREIWGYEKIHVDGQNWDVRYRPDVMTCVVKLPGGIALRVQLPRGGSRSSNRIPLLSYTKKFGQLHRNVLTRSGAGESLRVGGHGVEVSVSGVDDWWTIPDAGGNCRSLLKLLYQFGIARDQSKEGRRASYSLWTEHLQGEQGPPCLVPATFEREDE
jgi:hypothetical protein